MNTEDVWMDHWKDMERYGKIIIEVCLEMRMYHVM